jgi:hypothetical protein
MTHKASLAIELEGEVEIGEWCMNNKAHSLRLSETLRSLYTYALEAA